MLALVSREEVIRGRVVFDSGRNAIVWQAFPEEVVDALARALFDE
jgi:hypothetical protein